MFYNSKYNHAHSPHDNGVLGIQDFREIVIEVDGALIEAEELDDCKQGDDHDNKDFEVIYIQQNEAKYDDDFENQKFQIVASGDSEIVNSNVITCIRGCLAGTWTRKMSW